MQLFHRMRRWLLFSLVAIASAHAQEPYPSKPITLVTPFAVGGGSDLVTRILADSMRKTLGQSVVVQNIVGAGGVVGTQYVAHARADGYTLLLHHIGMATAPALNKNLQFDPQQSFEPIGLFADTPMIIAGGKHFPPSNAKQLAEHLRQHGDKVTWASSGEGSATHLCAAMFQALAGGNATMVQYKGAAPALVDVQAGRIDLLCDASSTIVPHIQSGGVKGYVLAGPQRLQSLPDLPTGTEIGMADLNVSAWFGLYAPAKTPKPVLDRLVAALAAANQDPQSHQRLARIETVAFDSSKANPATLRDLLARQTTLWTDMVRKLGIPAR